MTRSSALVERPILRLLLLALMGLALASRMALGATVPGAGSRDRADATDILAKLRAAMIMCHTAQDPKPAPARPVGPLLCDLLLLDQADNTHALTSNPIAALSLPRHWSVFAFRPVHTDGRPPLWRIAAPARGPPTTV